MDKTVLKYKTIIILTILFIISNSILVLAYVPYNSFTEDKNGEYVQTQDAYIPVTSIEKIQDEELRAPSDIYIDDQDNIYIADMWNRRVVVLGPNHKLKYIVGEGTLFMPTGVFVDAEGFIYVADYGNKLVFKFNKKGEVIKKYDKPNSPLYGKNNPYKPQKVTVDKRGNLYIISEGSTNGVIQLSPYGDFLGYFGTNDASFSFKIMLRRMFFTKQQKAQLFANLPPSPGNITIDRKGLVYTVTQGDGGKSIKKFNIAGQNILPGNMSYDPLFTDLCIGPIGNIYGVSQKGFIYEYDTEGNLIFKFGGPDDGTQRKGLFINASGIAVNSKHHIYVVDKERNNIQVFTPTGFTDYVHQALTLYKEGYYIKSQKPWSKVLEMNNLFDLAHKGLGHGYYKQQDYERALEEYMIANYKEGYSNSYWEIRNIWLQENLSSIFILIIGFYLLVKVVKYFHYKKGILNIFVRGYKRIRRIKLVRELLFLLYFIKHPFDGYYGIKREGKASNLSATILYLLFFVEYIFSIYYTNFIFRSVQLTDVMLSKEFIKVFAPFALWVVANYLVSTINEGEGKISDVYQATIYSFVPYLVFSPLVVILSNFLTFNEAFLFDFSFKVIYGWTAILLYIMVREIHNYSFKETFKNIFMTIFTMVILMLVIFIVYVLMDQVIDFINSVIQEVIIRARM